MINVPAPAVRSTITDDEFGGFRITIPRGEAAKETRFFSVLMWAAVAILALLILISDRAYFVPGGVFLSAWVLIGCLAAYRWRVCQIVMIDGKSLVVRTECVGQSREEVFELAEVKNIRAASFLGESSGRRGVVAFDYRGETYSFGDDLSEIELKRLVKTIRSRFPIPDDWTDAEPLPVVT